MASRAAAAAAAMASEAVDGLAALMQ